MDSFRNNIPISTFDMSSHIHGFALQSENTECPNIKHKRYFHFHDVNLLAW